MDEILDSVTDSLGRLIEALDLRDVTAVMSATSELAVALAALNRSGAVYGIERDRIDHALRQADAARIRVNVLADWTRQRIDRLSEIRGGSSATYSNKAVSQPAH